MNTPAGPWPTQGAILFTISLLLLLASMLCLTSAAMRLRHPAAGSESGLEPESASEHLEQGSHGTRTRHRVLAATAVSVLIAALAPVSASASTCVATGLGMCVQQAPPLQNPIKIDTGKSNASSGLGQGSQAKSGFKLPTSYAPPPSFTIKSFNFPKSAPSPKPHILVRPTPATQPHKYIPQVKITPSAKASSKNKQGGGFLDGVTFTGKATPTPTPHAKKKTAYAPLTISWSGQATPTPHAKKKPKQYSWPPIAIPAKVTPTPSVKPSPGAYPGGISGPFVFPSTTPPTGTPPTATPPTGAPPPGYPPVDLPPITVPQNCQLTEAEQQQLIDEATAQHAANEALYQQLLLKALLQQAALKAGSAMLTQQLSGHSGLSPQDVADLIKNGTVNPGDMAMAALQAASELDQETGGHTSQGTTCDQGAGQGQETPPGGGTPTHNNSDPNSSGQGQQGQGQSSPQGKGRVTEPEPGLWDSIDPHAQIPGWTFDHNVYKDPNTGEITVTTEVTHTASGEQGFVSRVYDPNTNTLIMDVAQLDSIPSGERWVQTTPSMGESTTGNLKGTPLQAYVTMSQMKLIEEAMGQDVFANPYNVHMSFIANAQTMLELAQLERQGIAAGVAIAQTHSVSYASTPIIQSGGQISGIKLVGGNEISAADAAKSFRQTPLNPADYGLSDSDKVLAHFDIDFQVNPRPGGVPHLPGWPGTAP